MRWMALVCLLFITFSSCKQKNDNKTEVKEIRENKTKGFEMYEMTPMASLMEEMYARALSLKTEIELGKTDLGDWPQKHGDILNAKMTDPSDRDLFFTYQAEQYLEIEKILYEDPKGDKVEQYNNMINSCLECHRKKCGGPIPRIQKLLIK